MEDTPEIAFILHGIATLTELAYVDAVIDAAKKQKRFLNTRGISVEAIRKNEELFDYSNVHEKDLPMAKRWFKGPKPPLPIHT
jgi:hypothetical protein